jgi:hypothetical protein
MDGAPDSQRSNTILPSDIETLQTHIRNNYNEFEERRRRKDAGIISPGSVTDDERRAYERIFLGDSEGEWDSETETDATNGIADEIRIGHL